MLARGCKQTKMAGPVADLDSTQAWSFTNVNVILQKSLSLPSPHEDRPSHEVSFERHKSLPAKLHRKTNKSVDNSTQVDQHEYEKLAKPIATNQHSSDGSREGSSTDCESDNTCAYECCCDEKCSIIDIVSGKCPAPKSTPSHFPHLTAEHLSKDERAVLCGHLELQFRDISKKYARLTSSVKRSLNKQGVKAMELTRKLMDLKGYIPLDEKPGLPLLQDRIPEMKEATTLDDVFDILSHYSSFFNHDIIEFIVEELGTPDDQTNLDKYVADFTEYCKRSVFECPFSICSKKSLKFSELVMKVVSDSMIKPYSMQAVRLFQAQVSNLLHITKHTLKLCSVEEGCLQLTFHIPRFLSTVVFPLNVEQRERVRDLGITKLVCDGVSQQLALTESEIVSSLQESHSDKTSKSLLPQPLVVNPTEEDDSELSKQAVVKKNQGDAYYKIAEYELAVESYTNAMELDPSNAVMATCKADALYQQGMYEDAERFCCLSLGLDDSNFEAYLIRARAKNKLSKLEDAIEDFKTVLKLDPQNTKVNTELARLEGELRRRKRQMQKGLTQQGVTEDVCELPPQPLPELEIVKLLDEWECMRALLGEEVLVSSNLSQKVPVSIFEQEGSVIGLFFSAIWCPPSLVFTPRLIDWYNNFKKGPNGHLLNIIFISSDEDEYSWKEYSAKMPWYGVHLKDTERQRNLHYKYNVFGIPTLVFVEAKTGKVISEEGRSIIVDDPTGEKFPWKPKPFTEIIADAKFIDQNEQEITWEQLQGKVTGFFFSAYRSDLSIDFTFKLTEAYQKIKHVQQEFEIIYVNFDENEEEWKQYCALMPWISLPYDDIRIENLQKLFSITDIPRLVLVNENCGIITTSGHTCVCNDPSGENFPWYVNTLTEFTPEETSETVPAHLVWFVPRGTKKRAKEVLEPLAMQYISKKAEENMAVKLLFFIASEENEASETVRRFARLPNVVPLLTIVDIVHNQVHISDHSEVTEENAKKFVYDYLTKKLFGAKLIKKL